MIKYPRPLSKKGTIGITAPSSGVQGVFCERLDHSIEYLESMGYACMETQSVRKQHKLASERAEIRAKEFMDLYINKDVELILPPWGGSFLLEILEYIDYEKLKTLPPKWLMGFSDTSLLLFVLLIKLDLASVHGPNALDFGCRPVHETVEKSLEYIGYDDNKTIHQTQTQAYQKHWASIEDSVTVPYNIEEKTVWKSVPQSNSLEFSGRLIGGCLDVLCKVIGTPFDTVNTFLERNKQHGFIWYLESCEMNAVDISLTLTQMRLCGWFKDCNGILIGRLEGYSDVSDYTLKDALNSLRGQVDVPVIYDVDIGHMPPQLTLINGALATVKLNDGKGQITQELK